MTDETLPQRVIIYVNRSQRRVLYTTAYTDEQVRLGLQRCTKRYGAHSTPIAKLANDLNPGDFIP